MLLLWRKLWRTWLSLCFFHFFIFNKTCFGGFLMTNSDLRVTLNWPTRVFTALSARRGLRAPTWIPRDADRVYSPRYFVCVRFVHTKGAAHVVVGSLDCGLWLRWGREGLWKEDTSGTAALKREERRCFYYFLLFFIISPHQEENMDLVLWFCGCMLPCLLPSAVKAEEVGKFGTLAARLEFYTITQKTHERSWKMCFIMFIMHPWSVWDTLLLFERDYISTLHQIRSLEKCFKEVVRTFSAGCLIFPLPPLMLPGRPVMVLLAEHH